MIVKFFELKKKFKKNKYFLLYGNNKGLIEETIKNILNQSFKNISHYDENEILKNIEILKKIFQ